MKPILIDKEILEKWLKSLDSSVFKIAIAVSLGYKSNSEIAEKTGFTEALVLRKHSKIPNDILILDKPANFTNHKTFFKQDMYKKKKPEEPKKKWGEKQLRSL